MMAKSRRRFPPLPCHILRCHIESSKFIKITTRHFVSISIVDLVAFIVVIVVVVFVVIIINIKQTSTSTSTTKDTYLVYSVQICG